MERLMKIEMIAVESIKLPTVEMRETMTHEGLEELMASIKEIGIVAPLTVKKVGVGYEVVAGARRLECARRLLMGTVPCVVQEGDGRAMEIIKIHENLKREDVDPVEEAGYYRRLIDEMGFSLDDLARATGRGMEYLEGRMEIYRWDQKIKDAVSAKAISMAVAKELMKFQDLEARDRHLIAGANNGVTARTMESWRLQYESQGERPVDDTSVGGGGAPPVLPYVSKTFCALCGENLHGLVTFYVPVSQRCLDLVREQQAPVSPTAGRPPA